MAARQGQIPANAALIDVHFSKHDPFARQQSFISLSGLISCRIPATLSLMSDLPDREEEAFIPADQQPIQRVVGRRKNPRPGSLPTREARAAMTANARYLTRAPKGVFFYSNHEEMTRDRERWTVDAMLARHSERD